MVRNQNPVYLDLSTETVYGTPTAATNDPTGASGNLVANSLLTGIPVITKNKRTPDSTPATSATPGAAATKSAGSSVASSANQLAAPETR
jgi:hypothetical protein